MSKKGILLYILGVFLCLTSTQVAGWAARVAGEQGVITTAPGAGKETESRDMVRQREKGKETGEDTAGPELAGDASGPDEEKDKGAGPRYVTIDFDDVDITLFIKFISDLTGKNFIVDKAVKGTVTIISPTKISVDEAYKVFESVLEIHGFTTVPSGNIIKIVPAVEARSKDIETMLRREAVSPEDKVVTQLIHLKYADPEEVKKLFLPLISKSSIMVAYPPTGMLIITDVQSNIQRLIRIIGEIDLEGVGEQVSVIPLYHATASVMAKMLNELLVKTTRTRKGAPQEGLTKIVSDERTNSLVVMGSEDITAKIRQLIALLDKEMPRMEAKIHVYYLQNASAEDLEKVLMAIPTKEEKEAKQGKEPVVSKNVQIVADKSTNSLVIMAGKDDYRVIEDVIKKLDITRRMVYIEALLMEVTVDKGFRIGVKWQAFDEVGSHNGRSLIMGGSSPGGAALSSEPPGGFAFGVFGGAITIGDDVFNSISALIDFIQTDSDVNILSTPQIMTTDNEEAEIVVAENRPFLTRQDITTDAERTFSNYEFRDVGVTLKITPQINHERFVRLQISQEVSQVVETAQDEIGLPVTRKRLANTTVVVKDGSTVVIGGLIDKQANQTSTRTPCLGSIPGLGWLFKSMTKSDIRTNLFVFLTPHIIENPFEAEDVYREKKDQIDGIKEGVIKMYNREIPQKEGMELR